MCRCDGWQTLPNLHWHCCVLSQEECIWFRGGYKWFLTAFPCQPKHLLGLYLGCSEARCEGYGQASFTKVASCNDLNIQNLASTVEACPGNAEEFQSPPSSWLLHSCQVTNSSTSWRSVADCHLIVLILDGKRNIVPAVFSAYGNSIGGRLEKKGISLVNNKKAKHLPRQIRPKTRSTVSGSLEHLMLYIPD